MAGWASGMRAGTELARGILDTYRDANMRREIEGVVNAKPEAVDAYKPAADDPGIEQAMANFQPGDSVVAPGLTPQRQTEFMGKTYDGDLAPEKVKGLRQRAMADVYTKFDPIKGMGLHQQLDQGDRAAEEFGWKRGDREKAEKLESGRRAYFNKLMTSDDETLAKLTGGKFSADGSGVEAMLTFDPQANKFLFASNVPGLPSRSLDRAELIQYAMGLWEAGNGDFDKGMRAQLDTVLSKRKLDDSTRADATTLAKANYGAHTDLRNFGLKQQEANDRRDYQQGMLGINRAELNLRGAQQSRPEFMQVYAPDGSVALVDKKSIPLQGGIGVLPKGYSMPKLPQELTETQKMNHAEYLKYIRENGLPKTQGEVDRVKAMFNVGGGSGGMPDPYAQQPSGGVGITNPSSSFVPIRPQNITKPTAGVTIDPRVDPSTFERVSTRGLFGGLQYGYRDPVSGKTYSVDEYNQLMR